MAETAEFVVSPGSWANPGDDPWRIQEEYQRASEAANAYTAPNASLAFAPPAPVLLPEFEITPPKPAPVKPIPLPPTVRVVPAPLLPLLGLIVPMAGGPPGTGDAPDDPSTISARYGAPPKPPALPPPEFAEPQLPPNWNDLANEPWTPPKKPIPWGDLVRLGTDLARKLLHSNDAAPVPEVPLLEEFPVSPPPVTRKGVIELPLWDTSIYLEPFNELAFATGVGFGPASTPFSTPGSDPAPGRPGVSPAPGGRVQPQPTVLPSPDLFGAPLPDVFANPGGNTDFAPYVPAGPRPSPGPPDIIATPQQPDPFVTAIDDPLAQVDPLAMFDPQPLKPDADTCSCSKPKPKKKKKKEDRTECWKGTYTQRARGISYVRREQVPCDAALARTKPARKPKVKTPKWRDVLNDVFQLPT